MGFSAAGKGKKMTSGRQTFVQGAAILGAAAFFTKLLGAVYRVPYQNITGNEGMFVYQQVYPLYSTLLILATAGFPLAISKLVSERLAEGDEAGARRVFIVSSVTLTLTGFLFFLLLYAGAPWIAGWMGNREWLTLPIRAVSFALLVVPLMSAIRGYFQGHQNMIPTALSQSVEQVVRVATILFAAWWFMSREGDVVSAGAGAVFGAFTGAVGALLVLLMFLRGSGLLRQVPRAGAGAVSDRDSVRYVAREIWRLSLPICLGSLVLPLFSLVDSFTVANLLQWSGWSVESSIVAKGIFDRGQPLIQFASFFATAIALSIVPAVAEAKARGEIGKMEDRASLACRMTLLLGLPASVGLAVVVRPTNVMLFEDASGSDALAILALTTVFFTLGVTSAGILQGMGKVVLPARNLLAGVAVKLVLNLLLIPWWDIRGAAAATLLAYATATLLNLAAFRGQLGRMFRLKETGWALLTATLLMAGAAAGVQALLTAVTAGWTSHRLAMTLTSLGAVVAGAAVYGVILLWLGGVRREELRVVPKWGPRLVSLLESWGLIR
jgi:PST family polysaccharide transporter